MPGGHLLQFDIPDAGDGVGIDDELVAVGGGCADVGLGIEFIPYEILILEKSKDFSRILILEGGGEDGRV